MRVVVTPKTESGRAVVRRMLASRGRSRGGFVAEAAAATLRVIMRLSAAHALDTGRYLRAWQEAYNDLPGVQPVPLVNLTPGRRSAGIRKGLAGQARFWLRARREIEQKYPGIKTTADTVVGLEASGSLLDKKVAARTRRTYGRVLGRYIKIRELANRAAEQLRLLQEADPDAPVIRIGGRRAASLDQPRLTSLERAYTKVYGGFSRVFEAGSRTFVRCVNREPHARIVESGFVKRGTEGAQIVVPAKRILQRGLATARAAGVPPLAAKKFRELTASAGASARR